jgi:tetratricopeptide (TPR) repeat protein/predicted Ser/Thr protein kinase
MDPERYRRVRELLHAAGGRTGAERAALLAKERDPEVRREVEHLLRTEGVPTNDLVPAAPPGPPEILGAYRLVREIGRGGMGTVYEAVDTRSNARVAVKVLHPHLGVRDRFAREARLGQQVSHRNVVRTFERVSVGGYDLLVMEYVEGRTLRELAAEWRTVPEGLLREIARQTAEGLAAIHAAGIVHRDLKPENLLLTGERGIRIMDLGVAKTFDASVALTREGQFLGSLPYAAPEQCGIGDVGPAADLYALGVILYELATGANPFRADTPGASLKAQLDLVPPPVAERSPDASAFFSELVSTLLAKDPARRFPSARALAEALADGERGTWWSLRERETRARRLPRAPVQRETGLRGRRAELDALRDAWRAASAGEGQVVLLEGEPGIGKSRLLDAFLRELDPEGAHVLYGAFPPGAGLQGLLDAIVNRFGRGGLEAEMAPRLGELRALVPGLADLLRGGGARLEPESLEGAFRQLLLALARERPVAWAVDDLHFAPERARAVAYAMARAAPEGRVLLLLSARALPVGELAGLERLPAFRRLPVGRLPPDDALALAREVLGDGARAQEVARRSDGVPFFACELAKTIRGAAGGELPSAVHGLLSARLSGLDPEERTLLDAGAVQGYLFDADLLATALELPVVTVLQRLADVERRTGLVRAVGRRHRFDHHLVQEVLYGELPPLLREEVHTRLAEALPEREGGEAARLLVTHYLRGRKPTLALPFLDAALDHLERRFLHEEALDVLGRALDLPLLDPRRAGLLVRQAGCLELLARREPQRAAVEEALVIAETTGDERLSCEVHLAAGTLAMNLSRDDDARTHFRKALDEAEAAGDERLLMVAMGRVGAVLARQHRDAEGTRILEQARDAARRILDPFEEVRALTNLGICQRHAGQQDLSLRTFEEALALCERQGLRRARCYVEGNLGTTYWLLGRRDKACTHLRRNLALAAEIGDRRSESSATGNLGLVLRDLGLLSDALAQFQRHLQLAQETGDRRAQVVAHFNLAELLDVLGEDERAAAEAMQADAAAREIANDSLRGRVGLLLARQAQGRGDADATRRLLEEALALSRTARDRIGEAWILLELAAMDPGRAPELRALLPQADQPALEVIAPARLGEVAEAEAALARVDHRLGALARLEARYLLWKATASQAHLEEAARLLEDLRRGAPPEHRNRMVERVEAYREIRAAAAPHAS